MLFPFFFLVLDLVVSRPIIYLFLIFFFNFNFFVLLSEAYRHLNFSPFTSSDHYQPSLLPSNHILCSIYYHQHQYTTSNISGLAALA